VPFVEGAAGLHLQGHTPETASTNLRAASALEKVTWNRRKVCAS
jgi:hypothetical protein